MTACVLTTLDLLRVAAASLVGWCVGMALGRWWTRPKRPVDPSR
jgi:hypothetical protein